MNHPGSVSDVKFSLTKNETPSSEVITTNHWKSSKTSELNRMQGFTLPLDHSGPIVHIPSITQPEFFPESKIMQQQPWGRKCEIRGLLFPQRFVSNNDRRQRTDNRKRGMRGSADGRGSIDCRLLCAYGLDQHYDDTLGYDFDAGKAQGRLGRQQPQPPAFQQQPSDARQR